MCFGTVGFWTFARLYSECVYRIDYTFVPVHVRTCQCLSGLVTDHVTRQMFDMASLLMGVERETRCGLGWVRGGTIFLTFLLVTFPVWVREKRIQRERIVKTKQCSCLAPHLTMDLGSRSSFCSASTQEIIGVTSGSLTQINYLCFCVRAVLLQPDWGKGQRDSRSVQVEPAWWGSTWARWYVRAVGESKKGLQNEILVLCSELDYNTVSVITTRLWFHFKRNRKFCWLWWHGK